VLQLTDINGFPFWVRATAITSVSPREGEGSLITWLGGGSRAVKSYPLDVVILMKRIENPDKNAQ
jgi:hypothetical protein